MVMHVELQATCSALGYQEGDKYIKEPDCHETLKDLLRFLRREDESCEIRRQLGSAQIVQNDLVSIIKFYHTDKPLLDTVIRVLVDLTQPAVLCFNNHVPQDKTQRNYYLEIESTLQAYKEAFVDEELFAIFTELLGDLLKLDWERRKEADRMMIERLLILMRNILHVPPDPAQEKRTDDDASIHDQVLWAMHVSGMEDVLLYIASSEDERQYCMHVLEIISLMFREQRPELLASAGVQRSVTEKEKDERELLLIREKEKAQKQAFLMKRSTRHSRFGGTFVIQNMKSISEREVIYHKSLGNIENLTFDTSKRPRKKSKHLQPIIDSELKRRSTLSIRLSLKDFCIQFLENCYNPLMLAVKNNLNREATQEHDETYYLWAMRFFMEFCRMQHTGRLDLISETMSVPTFHYIYNNLLTYYEMIQTDKKEALIWSKRVHLALKAYQELLMTLNSMSQSTDDTLKESARVMKSNIFYMMEFRDVFVTLLRQFNESRQSRTYLKDLVESTHVFMKMLEQYSKNSQVLVQKKKPQKRPRKQNRPVPSEQDALAPSEQELDDMWDEVSSDLSAFCQGREEIPTDVAPFDAASEVEIDQQRVDAMVRIQIALRGKRAGEAMALFRAARDVWPERNEFGSLDITPEEEFMALREICMADLPRVSRSEPVPEETGIEEEDAYNEAEEEEMAPMVTSEIEFNFKEYVMKFSKPNILYAYTLLLADFEKNSVYTNHCIVKMLHRVAIESGVVGMLFQIRLFRVFQHIVFSPLAKAPQYKELVKFACYIIRKFVEVAQNNEKVFVELLFWKTTKEAIELVDGYGTFSASRSGKVVWSEEQEMELMRLFEEFRDGQGDKDVADMIMDHIIDNNRTRRQIVLQLRVQGLITSAKDLKKSKGASAFWTVEDENELQILYEEHKNAEDVVEHILECIQDKSRTRKQVIRQLKMQGLFTETKKLKGSRGRVWAEEQEVELRELYDEHKHSSDALGNIRSNMTVKRPKPAIIDKLLELHLINYRTELKRRRGKSDGNKTSGKGERPLSANDKDDGKRKPGEIKPVEKVRPADKALVDIMEEIVKYAFRSQVEWIQRGLRETADDRENSADPQPVPIVPLTEDNEDAMEDAHFLEFLKRIRMTPPDHRQNSFWRIPCEMSVKKLRDIAESLTIGEDGLMMNPDELTAYDIYGQHIKRIEKRPASDSNEKQTTSTHRSDDGSSDDSLADDDSDDHDDDDDSSDDDKDDDDTDDDVIEHDTVTREPSNMNDGGKNVTIIELLKTVVQNDLRTQLQWIQRGLRRAAADREKSANPQPVPIVPLTEENEDAMEDEHFLEFLKRIGMAPPASEQEAFWRIPCHLSAAKLCDIADSLNIGEDGLPLNPDKLIANEQKPEEVKQSNDKKKDRQSKHDDMKARNQQKIKDDDRKIKAKSRLDALKQLLDNRKTAKVDKRQRNKRKRADLDSPVGSPAEPASKEMKQTQSGDESDSNDDMMSSTNSTQSETRVKSSRLKSRIVDSSDSEDDMPLTKESIASRDSDDNSDDTHSNTQVKKHRRIQLIDSDDESGKDNDDAMEIDETGDRKSDVDEGSGSDDDDDLPLTNNKQTKDSAPPFPATMLSVPVDDSDDDRIDDHIPLRRAMQKNVIQSDSDDDA